MTFNIICWLCGDLFDENRASCVCKKWMEGVKQSLGRKESLSFSGYKMDDASTSRLIHLAFSVKELDMYCFSTSFFSFLLLFCLSNHGLGIIKIFDSS